MLSNDHTTIVEFRLEAGTVKAVKDKARDKDNFLLWIIHSPMFLFLLLNGTFVALILCFYVCMVTLLLSVYV